MPCMPGWMGIHYITIDMKKRAFAFWGHTRYIHIGVCFELNNVFGIPLSPPRAPGYQAKESIDIRLINTILSLWVRTNWSSHTPYTYIQSFCSKIGL